MSEDRLRDEESLLVSGGNGKSRSEENWVSASAPDRRAAEALSLEVRRLAKSLGLEVGHIRVELASQIAPQRKEAEESG